MISNLKCRKQKSMHQSLYNLSRMHLDFTIRSNLVTRKRSQVNVQIWWHRSVAGVIDSLKCPSPTNQTKGSAACFTFHLPNDMQFVNVTSAQFWFYKEYDANDGFNQTFELYDLDHWDRLGSFHKETPFSLIETNVGSE